MRIGDWSILCSAKPLICHVFPSLEIAFVGRNAETKILG